MSRIEKAVAVLCISLFGWCLPSGAQNIWTPQTNGNGFGIEVIKPSFDSDLDTKFSTGIVILYGRVAFNSGTVSVDIPISRLAVADESATDFGNPGIGVAVNVDPKVEVSLGVRVPVTSNDFDNGILTGLFADFDRVDAYVPDIFPINLSARASSDVSDKAAVEFIAGVTQWIAIGDRDEGDTFLNYSIQPRIKADELTVSLGLAGKFILTEDSGFGNSSVQHHVGLTGRYDTGTVEPWLQLRLPVGGGSEQIVDIVDFVFGVGLMVRIDK